MSYSSESDPRLRRPPYLDDRLGAYLETQPSVDPAQFQESVIAMTHFDEKGDIIRLEEDPIGLKRLFPDGTRQVYLTKYRKEQERSGYPESASWGEAWFGSHRVVLFVTRWNFFKGTFGAVFGEKFVEATEHAASHRLPFIGMWSSGGARMQEGTVALAQMPRMSIARDRYMERTRGVGLPYISLFCEAWGGLPGSVGSGDLRVGVKRTRTGFSGEEPLRANQGTYPPEDLQTVEEHYRRGTLDYLIADPREFVSWTTQILDHLDNRRKNTQETLYRLPPIVSPVRLRRYVDTTGFMSILNDANNGRIIEPRQVRNEFTRLERFSQLLCDPRRIDTEDILRALHAVPLYVRWKLPGANMVEYPKIIAGLCRIGDQSFLVVGNQKSYYELDGNVYARPAAPGPSDITSFLRKLAFGQRMGLDLFLFTATAGAEATDTAELRNVAGHIDQGIAVVNKYKNRSYTVVLDTLGSGGGLLTTPFGHVAMLENSQAFVAAPRAAANILVRGIASQQAVEEIADTMKITAADQKKLGLVQEIVPEPEGGAEANPLLTIKEIRDYMVAASVEGNKQSPRSFRQGMQKRALRYQGAKLHREKRK